MPQIVISQQSAAQPQLRSYSTGICKLCDITDWEDREFSRLAGEIMANNPAQAIKHRKLWEFTKTIHALQSAGHFHSSALGLSVAGGTERLLFYLAAHIKRIVATDIYGSGDFAKNEAAPNFTSNPASFAPYPYPQDHLKPLYMNALKLLFPDNLFDFAICLSSIEHFGGFKSALQAICEMKRVVRPAGTIVITTDCSLNGLCTNEVFLPAQIEKLILNSGLKLMQPINWSLSSETLQYLIDMRCDDLNTIPHINLKLFGSVFTSICVALQKPNKSGTSNSYTKNTAQFDKLVEDISKLPRQVIRKQPTLQVIATWLQRKALNIWYRIQEFTLYKSF